jgi:hypothetical protein
MDVPARGATTIAEVKIDIIKIVRSLVMQHLRPLQGPNQDSSIITPSRSSYWAMASGSEYRCRLFDCAGQRNGSRPR